ncbi:MAG: hydroxymethylbilane synthase [Devosia sp.]|jgi:hydroxymethylbilane synthase|uniref:hydroxymethylbilane synthase n=1 Tax=unclassified Devosia TaxID=196773 RepID=UPI001A07A420|nr:MULTISPECIES: hydroxymethylbilane synthase [unclassified Devosia]MBF0677401.1 hydroxymethylbilane synthase [Devosia sp.]WEJ33460.1 hydroxymethylbilane synthase [Devosia sp. SD17-2]
MQSSAPFARIGTRGSPLALAQAKLVRELIATAHGVAEEEIEIEVFSTGGDRSQASNVSLSTMGGKGVFTKEIDEALLSGRIDIGVHSSKDVATGLPEGMLLAAFLEREDVRDAFMSVSVKEIDSLPERARFGTSSIRRAAQAKRLRPDLEIVPFRGNVHTRLQKLIDGVADATLLAMAGLNRLEEAHRVTAVLSPEDFMPAPAQGAIGLAIRTGDARFADVVAPLDHAATHSAIAAERAMLAVLDGSCRTPVGALSAASNGVFSLKGEILSLDGQTTFRAEGSDSDPLRLGEQVGRELLAQAGPDWLSQWQG